MTRLTNNPVENWIDQFKNNILQGNQAMPSELVGVNYLNLNAKHISHYQKYENQLGAELNNLDDSSSKKKRNFEIEEKGIYVDNVQD